VATRGSGRFLAIGAVAVLLLVVLSYHFWLSALGGFLVEAQPPAPADIVVVLAGDFFGNRILTAANLVREGIAPKALVDGPSEIYGQHESDLAIPFAVRHGYPASYFVALPNDARSTASEAQVVVAELRRLHARRIDLVTSNYHTRRAGRIFRAAAPDLDFRVVSAPDLYFTPDGWWKNRDGRKTFAFEWMKTVSSWIGM
jgi:uncharacterized SAM-binding protein YcdF (DUF218 family)